MTDLNIVKKILVLLNAHSSPTYVEFDYFFGFSFIAGIYCFIIMIFTNLDQCD